MGCPFEAEIQINYTPETEKPFSYREIKNHEHPPTTPVFQKSDYVLPGVRQFFGQQHMCKNFRTRDVENIIAQNPTLTEKFELWPTIPKRVIEILHTQISTLEYMAVVSFLIKIFRQQIHFCPVHGHTCPMNTCSWPCTYICSCSNVHGFFHKNIQEHRMKNRWVF